MKRGAISLALLALVGVGQTIGPQKANTLMRLLWNPNPPEESVAFYRVNVSGIATNTAVGISASSIELTNVLGGFPNGEYTVTVSAIGESGLESDPSEPLIVFWYGNKPGKPARPSTEFIR